MGRYAIRVPDIGEGIAEVEVVVWHVKPGDSVAEDQTVCELMTDKATVEVPSPVTGTVAALGAEVGATIAVGAELLRLEVEGAGNLRENEAAGRPAAEAATAGPGPTPASAPSAAASARAAASTAGPVAAATPASPALPSSPAPRSAAARRPAPAAVLREPGERPLASPAVRRLALDLGVELRFVRGSGPAGRILREDVVAWQGRTEDLHAPAAGGATAYARRDGETEVPVIGLRRRIAQKMQEAKRRIPHFSYVEEVDVTELELLRAVLNQRHAATRGKLTMLPLIARALVLAVRDFPQMNARYDDEATAGGAAGIVTRYAPVHLGIATQTETGLMVPVLRHAEARDPWSIAAEVARLADAARTGRGSREELSGSTLTITSLGPLGGIVTTPVINAPEVAIIGVNKVVERPVVRDSAIVVRKQMNLSSSFDHRVVDGMDAAAFVQAIRGLLETPALLFVE